MSAEIEARAIRKPNNFRCSYISVWAVCLCAVFVPCGLMGQPLVQVWPPAGHRLPGNPVWLFQAEGEAALWLAQAELVAVTGASEVPLIELSRVEEPGFVQRLVRTQEAVLDPASLQVRVARQHRPQGLRSVPPNQLRFQAAIAANTWQVTGLLDTLPPYWLGPLTPLGFVDITTVCGKQPHALFWCPVRETGPVLLAVDAAWTDGSRHRRLMPLWPNDLSTVALPLACCKADAMLEGTALLTVSVLDIAGNRAPMPEGTLIVHVPKDLSEVIAPTRDGWVHSAQRPVLITLALVLFSFWWMWLMTLGRRRITRSRRA